MGVDINTIKEVAKMHGIEMYEVEEGKGGFIIDETGEVKTECVFNDRFPINTCNVKTCFSDRLFQWNSDKYDRCYMKVWGNKSQYFDLDDNKRIERFLNLYFDTNDIKVDYVLKHENMVNRCPYWEFKYHHENELKTK